jgi:hypothetical protein
MSNKKIEAPVDIEHLQMMAQQALQAHLLMAQAYKRMAEQAQENAEAFRQFAVRSVYKTANPTGAFVEAQNSWLKVYTDTVQQLLKQVGGTAGGPTTGESSSS